ncbi:MAG TPA: phenylalanine--tRNA ligase subunit beta, partial [Chitinophagaceae bacterium]
TITPSIAENALGEELKEKVSVMLTGLGFTEILTNSITNSKYFPEAHYTGVVKLLNNLSTELNVMRPSMLHTALEVITFNLNRKNHDLKFFEFGKTYKTEDIGKYAEQDHLCLYVTGNITGNHWKHKAVSSDIYYIKGIVEALMQSLNIKSDYFETKENSNELDVALSLKSNNYNLARFGNVSDAIASQFDIKQPVYFIDLNWSIIVKEANTKTKFKEISKYPMVERDLAMIVSKQMKYEDISKQIKKLRLDKLKTLNLFDVFESDKLGKDKKSMAVNFTFLDEEKTLTDKEIDGWMNKIMTTLEKELNAEIRK